MPHPAAGTGRGEACSLSHGGEILTGGHRQIPSRESHNLSRAEPSRAPAFPAPWGLTAAQVSSGGSGQLWPEVSCTFGALGVPQLQQPHVPRTQSGTSPVLKHESEESPASESWAGCSCTTPSPTGCPWPRGNLTQATRPSHVRSDPNLLPAGYVDSPGKASQTAPLRAAAASQPPTDITFGLLGPREQPPARDLGSAARPAPTARSVLSPQSPP